MKMKEVLKEEKMNKYLKESQEKNIKQLKEMNKIVQELEMKVEAIKKQGILEMENLDMCLYTHTHTHTHTHTLPSLKELSFVIDICLYQWTQFSNKKAQTNRMDGKTGPILLLNTRTTTQHQR
jgi:hypothetical protein